MIDPLPLPMPMVVPDKVTMGGQRAQQAQKCTNAALRPREEARVLAHCLVLGGGGGLEKKGDKLR